MISLATVWIRWRRFVSVATLACTAIVCCFGDSELVGSESLADNVVSAETQADAEVFFENKVRPLLIDKCVSCHGEKKQHAGLRLDSRHSVLTGGDSGPSVVPMKPEESLLIEAVKRESFEMPPEETLDDDQVQILSRWVEMGAPWPGEMTPDPSGPDPSGPDPSYAERSGPDFANHWAFQPISRPEVPAVRNPAWPRNEIDFFILAQLEQQGLAPSQRATQADLARRIKWDLVGLPTSFQEVTELERIDSTTAISTWTDRWLDSPHYGERTGRHWLDVARYSDTKGYVFFEKHDFRVAFTYRDYVIDSFNADKPFDQFIREQLAADLIADAPHESLAALGFIVVGPRFKNDEHEINADRIDVVSRGLMGLTIACARCHDHKFDPITIDDYYALYGVFQNSLEPLQLPFRSGDEAALKNPQAVAIRNAAIELENHYHAQYDKVMDQGRQRLAEYLMAAQSQRGGVNTAAFDTITDGDDLNPELLLIWKQYLDDTETSNEAALIPWHRLAELDPDHFAAQAPDVLRLLTETDAETAADAPAAHPLVVKRLQAEAPSTLADVARIYAQLVDEIEALSGTTSPLQTPFAAFRLLRLFPDRASQVAVNKLNAALDSERAKASVELAQMLVLKDAEPLMDSRVFRRGNSSSPLHVVPRRFPTFFASVSDQPFDSGSGRLQLANAIASPQNPLTARVIVNRIWHQHFGRGLVTTPSNFGMQAPPPSHPKLLDYLASWFIDQGWSIKRLRRLILDSATYQQQSHVDAQTYRRDPENQWCSRMNRRRLDFETMRDTLLSIRGDLDLTVGGPSAGDPLELSNHRRSMYAQNNRLDVSGTMRLFDFPSPDISNGSRDRTSVPGQALFLMNHPLMMSATEAVSKRAAQASTPAASIEAAFHEILSRAPTPQELDESMLFLERERDRPAAKISPPSYWSYGYGDVASVASKLTKFAALPFSNGTQFQGGLQLPDAKLGWVFLNAEGGHPGNDLQHAAVIRWTAPDDMIVSVSGTLGHDQAPGDGVRGQIFAAGRQLAGPFVLHQDSVATNVETISLAQGETLDFVVDIHGGLGHDSFSWSPTITELPSEPSTATAKSAATVGAETTARAETQAKSASPRSWNYSEQFREATPIQMTPLQSLAQVLLMSNEFHFVD